MDWFDTSFVQGFASVSVGAYAVALIGGLFVIRQLVIGAWSPGTAAPAGWLLCLGSLIGGMAVSSAATPDWSPYTMFALWIPFFGIGAWAFHYSRFIKRGLDCVDAGKRALAWSVPSLVLSPLVAVALLVFVGLH